MLRKQLPLGTLFRYRLPHTQELYVVVPDFGDKSKYIRRFKDEFVNFSTLITSANFHNEEVDIIYLPSTIDGEEVAP